MLLFMLGPPSPSPDDELDPGPPAPAPDAAPPWERSPEVSSVPRQATPDEPQGSPIPEPHRDIPTPEKLIDLTAESFPETLASLLITGGNEHEENDDNPKKRKRWFRPGMLAAGLGAFALTPAIVTLILSGAGPAAIALLSQLSGFSAGVLTNLINDAIKKKQDGGATDVAAAVMLVEKKLAKLILTQFDRAPHDALNTQGQVKALLAHPVILRKLLTVTQSEGETFWERMPDRETRNQLMAVGVDRPAWLLEEVIEELEDMASQPSELALALEYTFHKMAQASRPKTTA